MRPGGVLFIPDDNLLAVPKEVLEPVFDEINRLGIRHIGEGTIASYRNNPALMKKIAKNSRGFLAGVEDFFSKVPGAPLKNELIRNFPEMLETSREWGLPVTWSVIFGFDHHDTGHIFRTLNFVLEKRLNINSHLARPYLGTYFRNQILSAIRIII